MKVPLRWLQDYVVLPSSQKELTDRLTAIGHMQDHPPVEVAGTQVLDLEVRQNRSDCLSIIGLAREVAAATTTELKFPTQPAQLELGRATQELVSIDPGTACYRFHAVRFDGLKVGPSPEWLVERLTAYGIKTINNVVDITNFVMVELGEPLHAFDRLALNGSLVIRQAQAGEKFTMLGDKTITLDPADIVVSDSDRVVAMGGMIGGLTSGVSDQTTSIVLEAATYNQANIRRSSLRHSLRTEASLRHEKFLHTDSTEVALKRAADLLQSIAGATVVEHTDAVTKLEPVTQVQLSLANLQQLTGLTLTFEEAVPILMRLGLRIDQRDASSVLLTIPYFRTDLQQEADVIEEVLRIHGYDQIPDRLPATPVPSDLTSTEFVAEEEIKDILVGFGFDEQITEPLTKETSPVLTPVLLQNSLNSEKTMLRTSLKPGLLAAYDYQLKFRKQSIALFEVGLVYFQNGDSYSEKTMVAGLMAGPHVSLLTVKGLVEALYLRLGYNAPTHLPQVMMVKKQVGYFEVELLEIMSQPRTELSSIRTTVPQAVFEDLSLLTPHSVKVGELLKTVADVSPFVYRVELGEYPRQMSDQDKSVFLKIQYLAVDGQIKTDDVTATRQLILKTLAEKFQARLRFK